MANTIRKVPAGNVNGAMTFFETIPAPIGRLIQIAALAVFAILSGIISLHLYGEEWDRANFLAEWGNVPAQYRLAQIYENTHDGEEYSSDSIHWYQMAAQSGHAEAQVRLAQLYQDGQGVAQDYGRAAHWYHMAADNGAAEAEFALGGLYYRGQGVSQDNARALEHYRAAAETGHTDAQNVMGVIYAVGRAGLPRDPQEAQRWWNMAAAQGHEGASRNLVRLQKILQSQPARAEDESARPSGERPRPSSPSYKAPQPPPAHPPSPVSHTISGR